MKRSGSQKPAGHPNDMVLTGRKDGQISSAQLLVFNRVMAERREKELSRQVAVSSGKRHRQPMRIEDEHIPG